MAIKPEVEKDRKLKYEAPQVIPLNDVASAQGGWPVGSCVPGTSAVTGDCVSGGGGAAVACTTGAAL